MRRHFHIYILKRTNSEAGFFLAFTFNVNMNAILRECTRVWCINIRVGNDSYARENVSYDSKACLYSGCWKSLIQVNQLLDNLQDFLCKDCESNDVFYSQICTLLIQ